MQSLRNLPPGVTDQMIEEAAGADVIGFGDYTGIPRGAGIDVYDDEFFLFRVPLAVASASESFRAAIAQIYDAGVSDGRERGKEDARAEIRRAMGVT